MDISTATTFASGLVGLIVPAFVQAFKKYIPSGYVGLVSLTVYTLVKAFDGKLSKPLGLFR